MTNEYDIPFMDAQLRLLQSHYAGVVQSILMRPKMYANTSEGLYIAFTTNADMALMSTLPRDILPTKYAFLSMHDLIVHHARDIGLIDHRNSAFYLSMEYNTLHRLCSDVWDKYIQISGISPTLFVPGPNLLISDH